MNNRIVAYDVPDYHLGDQLRETDSKAAEAVDATPPSFLWSSIHAGVHFQHAPMLTTDRLGLVSSDGRLLSLNKFQPGEVLDFKAHREISAAAAQHTKYAYVGAHDFGLYALDINRTLLAWRFLAGGPFVRRPHVSDSDVFAVARRAGMYCLDRETGRLRWGNQQSDEFLASNHRFVYTRDHNGNMLVLDRARGTVLARYDFLDWKVSIPNEITDRVYLGNHDGQLLCLHYEANRSPVRMKALLPFQRREKKEEKKDTPP